MTTIYEDYLSLLDKIAGMLPSPEKESALEIIAETGRGIPTSLGEKRELLPSKTDVEKLNQILYILKTYKHLHAKIEQPKQNNKAAATSAAPIIMIKPTAQWRTTMERNSDYK